MATFCVRDGESVAFSACVNEPVVLIHSHTGIVRMSVCNYVRLSYLTTCWAV